MSFLQAPSRRFLDGNNEISLILQILVSFFLQAPSQGDSDGNCNEIRLIQ
jgi:hypothetical protein